MTLATEEGAMEAVRTVIYNTYGSRYAEAKVEACVASVLTRCANWDADNVFGALDGHISNTAGTPPPGNFLPTFAELKNHVQNIFQDDARRQKQEHARQYHAEPEVASSKVMLQLAANAREEVDFHEKRKRQILMALKSQLGINFLHDDLSTRNLHCAAHAAVNREYQRRETEDAQHLGISEAVSIARGVIDSSGTEVEEYTRGGGPPFRGGEPWEDNPFSQRVEGV